MLTTPHSLSIVRLITPEEHETQLHQDVCAWLENPAERLPPPKYFYDAYGSELFDRITTLPEYYLTRAETAILGQVADNVMDRVRPLQLVEIGSGYSRKTQLLLEAMHRQGGHDYLAFDVSEDAIRVAADHLTTAYPWLAIQGVVGDFHQHLDQIPAGPRRLIAFLGSTIGNFDEHQRMICMQQMSNLLQADDYLLLGVDLVKDARLLEAAYDDSAGVTAAFNRNLLHVLNRELDGDIPVDAFEYYALFDAKYACVEMGQRAKRDVIATFSALDATVHVSAGQVLRTEVSCKFTKDAVTRSLAMFDMRLEDWYTDPDDYFALALIKRV